MSESIEVAIYKSKIYIRIADQLIKDAKKVLNNEGCAKGKDYDSITAY